MKEKIIIIGLGNPGIEYDNTRHNFGFMAVDKFADIHNIEINQKKGPYLSGNGKLKNNNGNSTDVILIKPICYMNNSGIAARQALKDYSLDTDSLIVVYDDLDMTLGKIRLRSSGSAGGHRGIENIINKLSTKQFNRLKLGIGEQPKDEPAEEFVLDEFSRTEERVVKEVLDISLSVLEDFAFKDFKKLMQNYNGNQVTHQKLGEELK